MQRVAYLCADGRSLLVVFDRRNGTAEVLSQDEDPIVLDGGESAGGFHYEAGGRAFFGQRGRASYVVGDDDPLDCRERQPRPR